MKPLEKILAFTMMVLLGFGSCSKEEIPDNNSTDSLTTLEIENLRLMREEEKLARDVYTYASNLYNPKIFSNISASEQSHMDFVLDILEKYNLEDPALLDPGKFNNPELQVLYDNLISLCDISLEEALKVGATIEDLDIYDLQIAISETNQADIKEMYEILECGSENHMRAFFKQLNDKNITYVPQHITQDNYDKIIAGSNGPCM